MLIKIVFKIIFKITFKIHYHSSGVFLIFTNSNITLHEAKRPYAYVFCCHPYLVPGIYAPSRCGGCQCRALTAVASVAKTSEAKFGKYYNAFIPGIMAIVAKTAPKAGTDPQVGANMLL